MPDAHTLSLQAPPIPKNGLAPWIHWQTTFSPFYHTETKKLLTLQLLCSSVLEAAVSAQLEHAWVKIYLKTNGPSSKGLTVHYYRPVESFWPRRETTTCVPTHGCVVQSRMTSYLKVKFLGCEECEVHRQTHWTKNGHVWLLILKELTERNLGSVDFC